MSDLEYAYEQIDGMAMELKGFVGQVEQRLSSDVDVAFKQLCADGWGGAAERAFQAASQAWHSKTLEMSTTLTQLHSALGTANTDMGATDQSLVSLFG